MLVNLLNSDHGWNSTVVRVSGPWKAAKKSDCGNVLRAWGTGVVAQGSELVSAESEKRVKGLYGIEHDRHNWSWLLDFDRPVVPPPAPRDKSSTSCLLYTSPSPRDS